MWWHFRHDFSAIHLFISFGDSIFVIFFFKNESGHILSLAYAIVDFENDASWSWFFEQFKKVYGVRQNMCFMSDRNKSILKGTALNLDIMPAYDTYHAMCWRISIEILNIWRFYLYTCKDLYKTTTWDDYEKKRPDRYAHTTILLWYWL